jgi:hypothetical protein
VGRDVRAKANRNALYRYRCHYKRITKLKGGSVMNTIIIDGRRELAELPEKWYTDGTKEANEWKLNVCYWNPTCGIGSSRFVGKGIRKLSNGADSNEYFEDIGHTYITPSEFIRLVYEPWKEGVKLPTSYGLLCEHIRDKGKKRHYKRSNLPAHINACIQLTNIMNFANDAFKGEGKEWVVWSDGIVPSPVGYMVNHPIRFTSKAAAKWAYDTFPEIFKAYWNVNN